MLDDSATPLALTARMVLVLEQLRIARNNGDPSHEWGWLKMLDQMIDTHTKLLQINGKFRPLEELDPELAERLAPPPPAIRYVPESRGRQRP